MRQRRLVSIVGALALTATLALTAAPAAGATRGETDRETSTWQHADWQGGQSAELNLVHGIPNLPVDIYVVKNFWKVKKLTNVNFGTAADLNTAVPGFVTPGLYFVDIVPTGATPWKPLLSATVFLLPGQSKSVVAYVTADAAGKPGAPTLGVFTNSLSSTGGQSRVTVRHLAVAPTVGVYANGAVALTPAFSNGQTATAVVPSGTYGVTVTAPNAPTTVLADLGDVALPANSNTLAFAIGTYPSTFKVATLQIPTAS